MSASEEFPAAGEGPPLTLSFDVRWGDRDVIGHVNHTIHLRWFEEVRVRFMNAVGLGDTRKQTGVGGVVARIEIDYRRPVFYPDTVRATCEVVEIGNRSLVVLQRAWSEAMQAVCAEARMVIVVIDDATGKPVPIPDETRRQLQRP